MVICVENKIHKRFVSFSSKTIAFVVIFAISKRKANH